MRLRGLALAAVFVPLAACADKPKPPAAPPPAATAQPSREPTPPGAQAPAPAPTTPRTVTPSPSAPAPAPASPLPPPSERSAAPGTPAASVLYVGVQRANFREGPDLKFRILAVLTKGTKLTVLEKSSQWYRVRLDDGKEGWVAESVTSAKPD